MNLVRGLSVHRGSWLAACGLIAVSVAAPLKAQNTASQIQLELSNTPLTTAIDLLMKQSGANIVVNDAGSLQDKKITVSLTGKTVEQTLDTILMAGNVPWYRTDEGTYFINAQAPVAPLPPVLPAPARVVTTEKISLQNQSTDMIMRALGMDRNFPLERSVMPTKTTGYTDRPFGNSLSPSGVMSGDVQRVNVNGRDWEIWGGNAYIADNGSGHSVDQANRGIQEIDAAGQVGFPGGRTTRTTRTGTTTGTTTGQPGTANQPGTTGTTGTEQRLIPEGIDTVFPYLEDNSLLVRGEPDAIDELKSVIALLDIPVRQVSIKAEFVTVTDSDSEALGLNWDVLAGNSSVVTDIGGAGASAGSTPTITVQVAQGNINATLTALRQRNRARTLLAPLISTLNNNVAQIESAQEYPFFQPVISQAGGGGGGNVTNYSVQSVTASTGLSVLPRINRDGSVTVQIEPRVEQVTGFVEGPNRVSVPILARQYLTTIRRVRSGESIVLGGLQSKETSRSVRGIPFLEDLPIIGRLFKSNDQRETNTQLLIFLTPTIIEESAGAQVSPG